MLDTTTRGARAHAGRPGFASRKGGGASDGEDYPNIIEEPIRTVKRDVGRAGKSGGKKSGKGGAAGGKGTRRAGKGSAKKRGG